VGLRRLSSTIAGTHTLVRKQALPRPFWCFSSQFHRHRQHGQPAGSRSSAPSPTGKPNGCAPETGHSWAIATCSPYDRTWRRTLARNGRQQTLWRRWSYLVTRRRWTSKRFDDDRGCNLAKSCCQYHRRRQSLSRSSLTCLRLTL